MAVLDRALRAAAAAALVAMSLPSAAQADAAAGAQAAVHAAETAFARAMAERDFAAFARHVAADAVFFGNAQVQRGRDAVLGAWKPFFDGPQAPFAWAPDQVEVLPSGQLALSTGPVRNAQGVVVARFNSIWRREPDGTWLVVFDKGGPPDPAPK